MRHKRIGIPPSVRLKVFIRDGFKCVYCGATPSEGELQADHVISVKNGGTNDIGNLVAACRECNAAKAAKALVAIEESDAGVYVQATKQEPAPEQERMPLDTHTMARLDKEWNEVMWALWARFLTEVFDCVCVNPSRVAVAGFDSDVFVFEPTFTAKTRIGSPLSPSPRDARILVLPLRPIDGWSAAEKAVITAAVVSGYETPTIIVMGEPFRFLAILVNERHKGNPCGKLLNNRFRPYRDWGCCWYPDEGDGFVDPRTSPIYDEVVMEPAATSEDGDLFSICGEA